MEFGKSSVPDPNVRAGSRSLPFEIDLNEIPLSSPRETLEGAFPGEVRRNSCGSCGRAAEGGGGERNRDWKCFKCLLSKGKSENSRSGVRLLDINASPPREADGEGFSGDAARGADQNGAKMHPAHDISFIGQAVNASVLHFDKSFSPLKASRGGTQISNLISEDVLRYRLEGTSNGTDYDSTLRGGLWPCHSTPLNSPLQNQSEVYLKVLREYIYERQGRLGDGWCVEFVYCQNKCKTSAVYCAPDGNRFDAMDDVARHLGLLEDHSLKTDNSSDAFTLLQKRLNLALGGKQSSRFSRNSCIENQNDEFASFQDSFPLQFEDLFILSLGRIDSRPSYHNISQIWPVGYRSCWHDRISGSIFVSEVVEGGDAGPIFRVRRYPCSTLAIPIGSTVLSRKIPGSCDGRDRVSNSGSSSIDDDEILSIHIMLSQVIPPHLEDIDFQKTSSSTTESSCLHQRFVNIIPEELGLEDCIGEFSVESRSSSLAWEILSQTLLHACHESYKQMGRVRFCCKHNVKGVDINEANTVDSLSKFCCQSSPVGIPRLIQNNIEFSTCNELLSKWLQKDRFGLDVEFVQEILEQLSGVHACSQYRFLNKRNQSSGLQTVRSGFLLAKRKGYALDAEEADGFSLSCKRARKHFIEDSDAKKSFPLGKPLSAKLPSYLVGDVLQAWEFLWHFSEILGLEEPFPFEELENELINPWLGTKNLAAGAGSEMVNWDVISCTGAALRKAHCSLLKAVVGELLLKVAAYVDPHSDAGECKSKRGRKKDMENSSSKKMKFDMLQMNELTWPELARRYILAFLSLEGKLDSAETNTESSKIFHCLQGDGGILCGSLTGVAGMGADAMLLAEAWKKVFGPVKNNELPTMDQQKSVAVSSLGLMTVNDSEVPEWAQALEPVRKLPTNVGARIRKCVNNALDKNPPEWAKKILEHSISKEVYKGNASGPTKRAVVSLLSEVTHKGLQPKPVKKEMSEGVRTFSDLLMKQCRIVLRRAAAEDEDKVFCNLLGKTLYPYDNDDKGLLGSSATVSRPLDFRVIDFRLAAGAYAGSHEAFLEDVLEMWNNIRSIYSDRSDLIEVAEELSQKFKDMYEKEVLLLVQKFPENSNVCITEEAKKEMDNLLLHVMESSLPKAPWDDGICKVCGVDKDDDNVLLCDTCDSEYHTYCLNPPLARIPDGNWYCPSCVAGRFRSQGSSRGAQVSRCRKKRKWGEFSRHLIEKLSQLAKTMGSKEYWNFNAEERTLLVKFLCDEALNSSILRDHVDHCASVSADLQQKLRFLSTEWKNLKIREEVLASHLRKTNTMVHRVGELAPDGLAQGHSDDAKSVGQLSHTSNSMPCFSGNVPELEDGLFSETNNFIEQPHGTSSKCTSEKTSVGNKKQKHKVPDTIDQVQYQPQVLKDTNKSPLLDPGHVPESFVSLSKSRTHMAEHASFVHLNSAQNGQHSSSPSDASVFQANDTEMGSLKNEISALQESMARIESELEKMSIRKEFLGRDSVGRVYWGFGRPGTCSLLVDRTMENPSESNLNFGRFSQPGMENPSSSKVPNFFSVHNYPQNNGVLTSAWVSYETDTEISELVGWLSYGEARERELKESILQWQRCKPKDSKENCFQNTKEPTCSKLLRDVKAAHSDVRVTKALMILEKRFGPCLGSESGDTSKKQGQKGKLACVGRMYRCDCLEPIWPSRHHCLSCHKTHSNREELERHNDGKCMEGLSILENNRVNEDSRKGKKIISETSVKKRPDENRISKASKGEMNKIASTMSKCKEPDCPHDFKEISSKFVTQNSLKELVRGVGLIGSGGNPSFVYSSSPHLDDPTLRLVPTKGNKFNTRNESTDLDTQPQQSAEGTSNSNNLPRNLGDRQEGSSKVEELVSNHMNESDHFQIRKHRSSIEGVDNRCVIPELSLRRLVCRESEILRQLKINLLDMDAALPEEAVRPSTVQSGKRSAWRAFVKSAGSIYEMVQATIILENMLKGDYLKREWWYWSSLTAAANISTLSALALRLCTLEAAIIFEKPSLTSDSIDITETDYKEKKVTPPNSENPKTASDLSDTPKPKSRSNKRRKDSGS